MSLTGGGIRLRIVLRVPFESSYEFLLGFSTIFLGARKTIVPYCGEFSDNNVKNGLRDSDLNFLSISAITA